MSMDARSTLMRKNFPNPAAIAGAPQAWMEWFTSIYDPDVYEYRYRMYAAIVKAVASTAANKSIVSIDRKFFCTGVRSFAKKDADGSAPAFSYRIQVKGPADLPWTGDSFDASLLTGDAGGRSQLVERPFPWARELNPQDSISILIDNTDNPANITVDVALMGFEVEARRESDRIVRRQGQ